MTYSELKIELCKDNVPSHCIKITRKIFFFVTTRPIQSAGNNGHCI